MKNAYGCATHAVGISDPNPAVGAIIVDQDHKVIGKGFTQPAGSSHAEIVAIKDTIRNHGEESLKNSTLYATLEPCSHHGRTPPCVDAIIQSKMRSVFIDQIDPNKKSSGKGIQKLNENGIHTCLLEEKSLEEERFFTLTPFLKRISKNLPLVILKWAQSKEGFLSPEKGASGKISSAKALEMVHRMRHIFRACLATSGTVDADQPGLNVRFDNFYAEGHLQSDHSFFSDLLLRRPPSSKTNYNEKNYRYFMIPHAWNEKQITHFYKKQSAIDEHFHFMISNRDQDKTCQKRNIPFSFSDRGNRVKDILKKITSDGHNQVLIESGPTMAEWLVESDTADMLICLKSQDRKWSSGKSFSISNMLAKDEIEKISEKGFKLISNLRLEKDEILCFVKKSRLNQNFFKDSL